MSVGDSRHWVIFELTSVEAMPAAPLAAVEFVAVVDPVAFVAVVFWSLLAIAPDALLVFAD